MKTRIDNVLKPDSDRRTYRYIKLENGMSVMCISDPETDKAAAACQVDVGSWHEPKEIPGLAHFLEHMLFLGSEKYKDEREYEKYLSEHGGSSNAYTTNTATNYFFDVSKDYLYESLDRFSQFFLSPLMDSSATDREMNAVDSENKNNLLSDGWRLNQLSRSFGNPNHPYSRFSTGNLDTLRDDLVAKGIDIREVLLKFHQTHYSSNIMNLVILGKEDLDTLEKWAIELFQGVKNIDFPKTLHLDEPPVIEESLPVVVNVVPVKDVWSITFRWTTMPTKHIIKKQISHYISHLIGHEGEGSLYCLLKDKGWANGLVAGCSAYNDDFDVFVVDIDLTKDGFEKREEVVKLLFQYIEMMRRNGPQEWIFNELKLIDGMAFKYLPLSKPYSYVHLVASLMSLSPTPEETLKTEYLFEDFDKELVSQYLDQLVPQRALLMYLAKEFEPQATNEEKWYGTKYFVQDNPKDYMKQFGSITSIDENLRYPEPNDLIPDELSLKEVAKLEEPALIRNNEVTKCWYYPETSFKVPHVNLKVALQTPCSYSSPSVIASTRILIKIYENALNEFAYNAHMAGISYGLSAGKAMDLFVEGFSQKLPMFVKKLFEKIMNLEISLDKIVHAKEKVLNMFKSKKKKHAYVVADELMNVLTLEPEYRLDDLISSVENITIEDIQAYHQKFFENMTTEWLICGNIVKEDALKLLIDCEEMFGSKPVHHSLISCRRVVKPPKGKEVVYLSDAPNPDNKNSAIVNWYPVDTTDNLRNLSLTELCGSMLSEPAYSQLRTQEQLGYIVWASKKLSYHVTGFRVTVQSERSPDYLDERIEDFISKTEQTLVDMSDKEFDSYRTSLIARVLEKLHSLSQVSNRLWAEISSKLYTFNKYELVAKELETVTQQEFIDFFVKYIKTPSSRRKYSVRLFSGTLTDVNKARDNTESSLYVTDPHIYKKSRGIYKTSILSHEAI